MLVTNNRVLVDLITADLKQAVVCLSSCELRVFCRVLAATNISLLVAADANIWAYTVVSVTPKLGWR